MKLYCVHACEGLIHFSKTVSPSVFRSSDWSIYVMTHKPRFFKTREFSEHVAPVFRQRTEPVATSLVKYFERTLKLLANPTKDLSPKPSVLIATVHVSLFNTCLVMKY